MYVRRTYSSCNRILLPAIVFTVVLALFWHLQGQPTGGSHDVEPVGVRRSEVESILDRYKRDGPTALSVGTPADAALAACIVVKDSHEDLREVKLPTPSATAPKPALARA